MSGDDTLLKKRFAELAMRSIGRDCFVFTDFLGLAEQSLLAGCREAERAGVTLFGGVDGCERRMARFGDPERLGYEEEFPIVCIKAAPAAPKFADALSHRDVLGAVMNLGIEREVLGDIFLREGEAYFFAEEKIAPFLLENLKRAKHTELRPTIVTPPTDLLVRTEEITVQVGSERLDAVIARVFSLSREEAQSLFPKGLVYLDGRATESPSALPREGNIVSVRTFGRFLYRGVVSFSRKGKLNVLIEKYV